MQKIALIPARSGSKRIIDKNIAKINGHPLIAYAIFYARASGVFDRVVVLTDSPQYGEIAKAYGAEVPYFRDDVTSQDGSPDILWLKGAIEKLLLSEADIVCILRPTSPLRNETIITDAYETFLGLCDTFHSLRAMSPVSEHPGKMWRIIGDQAIPLLPFDNGSGVPWHSSQSNTLPHCFVQNASMEFVKVRWVLNTNTISGWTVAAYIMTGYSSLDINFPEDLDFLEYLVLNKKVTLPNLIESET